MPNFGKIKLPYQILLLTGIAVLVFLGVWQWHKDAIKVAESDFIERQRVTIVDAKQRQLEGIFNTLYRNLRTISLLPSVRNITGANRSGDDEDVVAAGRFTPEGQQTVQQIYNNLIGSVSVSEIYAVIDGLDPSKGQIPFFMYDTLVFGAPKAEESAAKDPDFPEEDESAEYAYFPIQTAAIKASHGQFTFTDLDQIPAFASPLMRTCDNTQYPSKAHGDANETNGILYSVPFYNAQNQEFTGVISGIVRGNVFEAALLGVPFVPITDEDRAEQKKSNWQMPDPARFMLANEKYEIHIKDRRVTDLAQQLSQGEAGRNTFHVPLKVYGDSEWVMSYYLPESMIRAAGANIDRIFTILSLIDLGLLLCSVAVIVLMRRTKEKAVREVGNVFKALAEGHLMEQQNAQCITTQLALDWAQQPSNAQPALWAQRLSYVRCFARHHIGSDPKTEVPPPGLLPFRPVRAHPYLYSIEEVQHLLEAALQLSPSMALRRWTFHALLGLLSVTGLRVGEALRLKLDDVDLDNGVLTVRGTKFGKSRLVPIHVSTREVLADYRTRRARLLGEHDAAHFFVTQTGHQLDGADVRRVFYRLSRQIGLRAGNGSHGPRLHDLRHRFAVETLLGWYRSGQDVERRLPVLSTYLGHVHVSDTYWYLSAHPALMNLAMNRLEQRWEDRP